MTAGAPVGSSPRMRGKRYNGRCRLNRHRIIPAHAGQTTYIVSLPPAATDHPRACGANLRPRRERCSTTGSSPRMRGKHVLRGDGRLAVRIIPAHAGQTLVPIVWDALLPDHPRACGANQVYYFDYPWDVGSSPRMRGKRLDITCYNDKQRIIPAHAGQTG